MSRQTSVAGWEVWESSIQVAKKTWHMHKHCVLGSLSFHLPEWRPGSKHWQIMFSHWPIMLSLCSAMLCQPFYMRCIMIIIMLARLTMLCIHMCSMCGNVWYWYWQCYYTADWAEVWPSTVFYLKPLMKSDSHIPRPRPAFRRLQYGKAVEGLEYFIMWVT